MRKQTTALISPEALFSSLLEVERKITIADERFAVSVIGERAHQDTRKVLAAIGAAESVFAQPSLSLKLRRRKRR